MRTLAFAKRNTKEILRDPLNIFFGLGFPIVILLILTAIQANVPVSLFELESLTPGITVFGLSFITLFSATLISKDRESAFLQRLYTTPMRSIDFIFGYALPLLPIAACQSFICYAVAMILGLKPTYNIAQAIVFIIPIAFFYISLGLLCGCIFNSKQVGGICGALLTNLTAFLSGIWFDIDLVGAGFKKVAELLPFIHAVELERSVFSGVYDRSMLIHLGVVLIYSIVISSLSVSVFIKSRKRI